MMKYSNITLLVGSSVLAWASLMPILLQAAPDKAHLAPYVQEPVVMEQASAHESSDEHSDLKPENVWKRAQHRYKVYKRQHHEAKYYRQEFTAYVKRNAKEHRDPWFLANDTAQYASLMIEKHYDGVNSVVAGALCLRELAATFGDPLALRAVRDRCRGELATHQNYKFAGELSPELLASSEQELHHIFPDNPELVAFLMSGLTSDMECSIQGGNAQASWFVGGSIGGYSLKCMTPLGRRLVYAKVSTAATLGFGGDLTFKAPSYVDHDGHTCERTYRVPMDFNSFKPNLHLRTGASLGLAADAHKDIPLCNKKRDDEVSRGVEKGAGLGVHVGAGFGGLIKVKNRHPDFRQMFTLLALPFA